MPDHYDKAAHELSHMKENKDGHIRILFIEGWGDFSGGGPVSLFNLIKGLDRGKYIPIVICPSSGSFAEALRGIDVRVEILKIRSLKKLHLLSFITAVLSLLRLMKKENIGIVHCNAGASRESVCSAIAAKAGNVPFIYHARVIESGGLIDKILAKLSAKIIVISEAVRKKYIWLRNSDRIVKIHNGVNLDDFHPGVKNEKIKIEFRISQDMPVIGTVGNLIPWKGHRYFLEAAKKIKDRLHAKFIIAGEDLTENREYKLQLQRTARDLGISRDVIFTGARKDVADIMAALDIFVLPSIDEPFGRVLIEAMACGKPVVATMGGGVPEIVEHGKTGLLVPVRNADALANALLELMKDTDRSRSMGEAGRQRAERLFSIKRCTADIEKLYEETCRTYCGESKGYPVSSLK